MKTKFLTCVAFLVTAVTSTAQITEEAINSDQFFAAGGNHAYPAKPDLDTPAPKAYKPVYISHVGRHGSRYLTTKTSKWDELLGTLDSCAKRELLTPKGKELADFLRAMAATQVGHVGHLTALGGAEHFAVAERMYERFKPVWTNATRNAVVCRSTDSQRCISSMCWSTNALKGKNPKLSMTFDSSTQTSNIIRIDVAIAAAVNSPLQKMAHERLAAEFDGTHFYNNIFTDPRAAVAITGAPSSFCFDVYDLWRGAQSVGMNDFDARKYFTAAELIRLQRCISDRSYAFLSGAANSDHPVFGIIDKLVGDVIDGLDAAVEGNEICAHLRYTHDTALLPLLFKLHLDGYNGEWPAEECYKHWDNTTAMPMCTNLQIILYTAKGKEPLVKILVNENERDIVSLTPVQGHYYKWSDVKEMLKNRKN